MKDAVEQYLDEYFEGNRPEQIAEREKIYRWIKTQQARKRNYYYEHYPERRFNCG